MGCKVDLLIPAQISSVHKIETVKCTVFLSWRLWMPDLKHVSPKVECFVISSLSGKAGADTDQGSGCRLGGGAAPPQVRVRVPPQGCCFPSGAQWPLMPQPQVLCGPESQNWRLLYLPGVCENRLQTGKTLSHSPTTGKHYRPWIFQMSPQKTPQRTTHRIQLL